ncbi:MAG: YggS family pyridoxal phosphate-dependent enzyme [Oscillospiraceae bacterium]|nr:YggS family pyridoxal phosphate-dependent enzyme [Oscillospiraceae bacterium]
MTEKSFLDIEYNYNKIIENIENAKQKSSRNDIIAVMAVTKTVDTDRINSAISCGISLLGENRVQEFLQKHENYHNNCEIHFIGGLQSNKVKYIIDKVSMIHSVDSVKLAEEINKRAVSFGKVMDVLVEINIADEDTKHGVSPERAEELLIEISEFKNIRVRGLMTIPPFNENSESYFEKMQRLYESMKTSYNFDTLSMGMSGDYIEAIKYGSNIVRLGSALFGYRN